MCNVTKIDMERRLASLMSSRFTEAASNDNEKVMITIIIINSRAITLLTLGE